MPPRANHSPALAELVGPLIRKITLAEVARRTRIERSKVLPNLADGYWSSAEQLRKLAKGLMIDEQEVLDAAGYTEPSPKEDIATELREMSRRLAALAKKIPALE